MEGPGGGGGGVPCREGGRANRASQKPPRLHSPQLLDTSQGLRPPHAALVQCGALSALSLYPGDAVPEVLACLFPSFMLRPKMIFEMCPSDFNLPAYKANLFAVWFRDSAARTSPRSPRREHVPRPLPRGRDGFSVHLVCLDLALGCVASQSCVHVFTRVTSECAFIT